MTCNNDCFNCIYPDCIVHSLSLEQQEKEKIRLRKYYQSHTEQCKEAVKKWRKSNPQKVKEYSLKNGRTERRKAYLKEYNKIRYQLLKMELKK